MDSYDFIIGGAGASGCLLASRLAKALPQHTVLLLDAGGENADSAYKTYGERHSTFMTAPGYNWGYKTVPQAQLQGREINYDRGKGLGGSTAINFCVYTRGPQADYDRWARLVDDDSWSWENAKQRFKKIETFRHPPKEYKPFANAVPSAHGYNGLLDVGLTETWDPSMESFLNKVYQHQPRNLDHNSGDPLGVSICQVSAHNGHRTTASGAFLLYPPPNLTIVTKRVVTKVMFDKHTAVGVELLSGKKYLAKREVILSAGAIDSPKLLLLSGIGPSHELTKHGITIIKELSGVGKNLEDHLYLFIIANQKPGNHHRSSFLDSPDALKKAREQWVRDKTGPLADLYLPQMIAWLKSPTALASIEFRNLDADAQNALLADTKPTFELLSQGPNPGIQAPTQYLCTMVGFNGGAGGTGSVSLRSSDPTDHPNINPSYFVHPFDRRVAIEAVRETLDLFDTPALANERLKYIAAPKGRLDEDIMEFVSSAATSMWHPCCTVKMGKLSDPETCVDKDFKVCGFNGLRVVDMSVAPLLPSAHTQAVAYLTGETAADKIIAEYA